MAISLNALAGEAKALYEEKVYNLEIGIQKSSRLNYIESRLEEIGREVTMKMINPGNEIIDTDLVVNKSKVPAELVDYHFRHFGADFGDALYKLEDFQEKINKRKGEAILIGTNSSASLGKIDGPCEFSINRTFRYMKVPILANTLNKPLKEIVYSADMSKDRKLVWVNPDIFGRELGIEIPWVEGDGYGRETNYSKQTYIGGDPPEDFFVYFGEFFINSVLNDNSESKEV